MFYLFYNLLLLFYRTIAFADCDDYFLFGHHYRMICLGGKSIQDSMPRRIEPFTNRPFGEDLGYISIGITFSREDVIMMCENNRDYSINFN